MKGGGGGEGGRKETKRKGVREKREIEEEGGREESGGGERLTQRERKVERERDSLRERERERDTFSWKTKQESNAVAWSTESLLNAPLKISSVSKSSSPLLISQATLPFTSITSAALA